MNPVYGDRKEAPDISAAEIFSDETCVPLPPPSIQHAYRRAKKRAYPISSDAMKGGKGGREGGECVLSYQEKGVNTC